MQQLRLRLLAVDSKAWQAHSVNFQDTCRELSKKCRHSLKPKNKEEKQQRSLQTWHLNHGVVWYQKQNHCLTISKVHGLTYSR